MSKKTFRNSQNSEEGYIGSIKKDYNEKRINKYHNFESDSESFNGPWRNVITYEMVDNEDYDLDVFISALNQFHFEWEDNQDDKEVVVFTNSNSEVSRLKRFLKVEMDFSEEDIQEIF